MPTDPAEREDDPLTGPQASDAPEPAAPTRPSGASDESRLAAAPAVDTDAVATGATRRGRPQLLTGRMAASGDLPPALSPMQLAWRKLRKNRLAILGGIVLIVLYGVALLAPFIAPYGYSSQGPAAFHPPMRVYLTPLPTVYETRLTFDQYRNRVYVEDPNRPKPLRLFVKGEPYRLFWIIPMDRHLFGVEGGRFYLLGTDQFGRDYFSRLLYASQISLSVGLIGIAISFTLGLLVGGISGFYGGHIDDVIMRVCEVIMSVPDFYLLLALAAALPPNLPPALVYIMIIAILSLVGWAGMARVVRGMVLSVREREYVEAARALGVPDLRIIVRHIVPSTFTYAIVSATMAVPGYILAEASLSFLGLGIREPLPSWGNMLSAAQSLTTLEQNAWILAPGFVIALTTLSFNFLGDGLRDALDPKSR